MNAFRVLSACAAISAATIMPAKAYWPVLGSVHIGPNQEMASFQQSLPGRLEWLGFQAVHGDVSCDSVHAIFADGSRHQVWRGGRVSHGGATAELPATSSTLQKLDFRCRGTPAMTEIQILGDPGRFLSEWRDHPDWSSHWWYRVEPNQAPSTGIARRS